MAQAGLGADLQPLVVALASMAPGVSPVQRVQLATLFVRNAMAALNNPAPALRSVMLPAASRGRPAPAASRAKATKRTRKAAARKSARPK